MLTFELTIHQRGFSPGYQICQGHIMLKVGSQLVSYRLTSNNLAQGVTFLCPSSIRSCTPPVFVEP